MQANPVLKRLTRGDRWYSHPKVKSLAAITALMVGILALIALIADPLRDTPLASVPMGLVFLGGGIAVLNPLVVLGMTALITMREAQQEDFMGLALADVAPKDIAHAYLMGAQYRLRYLWAFLLGFAPGVVIALAHMLVATGINPACAAPAHCEPSLSAQSLIFGLLIAMLVVAAGIAVTLPLYLAAQMIGAWIGVRWADRTPLIAGGVVAAGVALLIALISLNNTLTIAIGCAASSPLVFPVVGQAVAGFFEGMLHHAIEMRGSG